MTQNEKREAYTTCHELMLINPNYVPSENSTVSYILVQIADTENSVGISGMIIDPKLPESGSAANFIQMPLNQRIAVLSLTRITGVVSKTHQEIQEIQRLASNKETWDEAADMLTELFGKSFSHTPKST